jgi:hypothetical protein
MQSELNRSVHCRPTNMAFCRSTVCTPQQSVARRVPLLVAYPVSIRSLQLGTARRYIGRSDHSLARGYGVYLTTG